MTHSGDHISVFGRKLNCPNACDMLYASVVSSSFFALILGFIFVLVLISAYFESFSASCVQDYLFAGINHFALLSTL